MKQPIIATGHVHIVQFLADQSTAKYRRPYWTDEFKGTRKECATYIEQECRAYGYVPEDYRIVRRQWRDREVKP